MNADDADLTDLRGLFSHRLHKTTLIHTGFSNRFEPILSDIKRESLPIS